MYVLCIYMYVCMGVWGCVCGLTSCIILLHLHNEDLNATILQTFDV